MIKRVKKKYSTLKPIRFTKLVPTIITLIGLIIGMNSIRLALQAKWDLAVYSILIATLIDGIDGRVARILNASSQFGAELDSLCDFTNFGFCPALIIYLKYSVYNANHLLYYSSITLFVVSMSVRLARFNSTHTYNDNDNGGGNHNIDDYFVGVPAPIGGLLILLPIMLEMSFFNNLNNFIYQYIYNTHVICIYIIFISILVCSNIKTISIKNLHIKPKKIAFTLFITAVIMIYSITYTWYMLSIAAIVYLLFIPYYAYRKNK